MKFKIIPKIELVLISLIVITLLILWLKNFNLLILKSPKGEIYDRYPEFIWRSNHKNFEFYLDNNDDFSSPLLVINLTQNSYKYAQELAFDEYYWKMRVYNKDRFFDSKTERFEIKSLVALETKHQIKNVGNTRVKITGDSGITGAIILDVNELLKKNFTNMKAEQNE